MKTIGKILGTFILFFCVTNILQAQDVLEMVNTPEALSLQSEIEILRKKRRLLTQKYASFYERFNQVSEELGELRRQESGSKDPAGVTGRQKELEAEMNMLRLRRDSIQTHETEPLSDRGRDLERRYSIEITKSKEPQAILKKMKEANGNDDSGLAQKILKDYTDSLLRDMRERFRLRKIDKHGMFIEHNAIIKLDEALNHLAFPPRTVIN